MKLSIIIPVYNEKNTIKEILSAIEAVSLRDIEKEIIVIDDCSTDGTGEILKEIKKTKKYKIIYQAVNKGKGFAVREGFRAASGDVAIIQDADLEYDPRDYEAMLLPIISGKADAVFGSRFMGSSAHRVLFFWHYAGNKFLTALSNIFTNLNLSDMEACYKAFSKEAIKKILPDLTSERFGIEVELVARAARHKLRIYEVGISYSGRTYEEGKKINWKDGLAAIWHIIRFNLF